MSDSALSVRYRKFLYQTQSDIADHGYQTKCPPMVLPKTSLLLPGEAWAIVVTVFLQSSGGRHRRIGTRSKRLDQLPNVGGLTARHPGRSTIVRIASDLKKLF
jgi:hypothetical protein